MIKTMLIVGAGSFLGGALRYWISMLVNHHTEGTLPYGTLAVNMAGCLLIGLFYGIFDRCGMCHSNWCLLLTTGVCGGFTTFSTFSRESLLLLQEGNYLGMAMYVMLSVVAGLVLTASGWAVTRL